MASEQCFRVGNGIAATLPRSDSLAAAGVTAKGHQPRGNGKIQRDIPSSCVLTGNVIASLERYSWAWRRCMKSQSTMAIGIMMISHYGKGIVLLNTGPHLN
jgi:hypothetical protein